MTLSPEYRRKAEEDKEQREYEEFLDEIEEDRYLRKRINVVKGMAFDP